jgi:hypothetical protein
MKEAAIRIGILHGADGTVPPGRGVSRQAAAKSMSQVDSRYNEGALQGQHLIIVNPGNLDPATSAFPFTGEREAPSGYLGARFLFGLDPPSRLGQ